MIHHNCNMPRIIQRMELLSGKELFAPFVNVDESNPTLQNIDTSLISLLKGTDECGKVNNFAYSEEEVVDCYRDDMEQVTNTEHELAYYQGLAENVAVNAVESAAVAAESSVAPVESANAETAATSETS